MPEPWSPAPHQSTPIDWRRVHSRLDATRMALERGALPSPAEARLLLKARAQALARVPKPEAAAREVLDIVEFRLADDTYGVEARYVREVFSLPAVTPLPCTPPFVRGIVNLRGQMLSVIDLRRFFDLPEQGLTDRSTVIVLHNDIMVFGLLAEAILGVRAMPLTTLQPALPMLTGRRASYLKGVTPELLVLLDAGILLADPTLRVHEEVAGDLS
jgi:purine-binding chemotaxis protein CheW